jgi:fructose-1,6-bisphosphatase/inositol monophosphatase family enzyme
MDAAAEWRGVLRTRYMPAELRSAALDGFAAAGIGHSEVTASGVAYPMAATGELTHALYWRTLPWDHAPGALIAQEAGLVVGRLDGSEYRPWDARHGVLTATDQRVWDVVRGSLPADLADESEG